MFCAVMKTYNQFILEKKKKTKSKRSSFQHPQAEGVDMVTGTVPVITQQQMQA